MTNSIVQLAFRPVDHRDIWQWFEEEGTLPSCYAAPGKFGSDLAPMCKDVFRALKSKTVRDVTVMAGVQCIKTLIGEAWLLWSVPNSPGPMQWLQTTDEEAKEHVRERFMALVEHFPIVHQMLSESRHDKTAAYLQFVNATIRMEGCGQGNLQRKSIKNQMRSEIHQAEHWLPGRLKEASSRMTQFHHNSKSYTESQAGYDADLMIDDMHAWWKEGSSQIWNFRCLDCRKLQPFHWTFFRQDGTRAAMRWEDSERTRRADGAWRWSELAQTIRYECIYCGHQHADNPQTRRRMSEGANCEFVSSHPEASSTHESFTWNQLAMPNLPWFETRQGGVKNFLLAWSQAKLGYDKPLREFFQKVIAEPYHPGKHAAIDRVNSIEIVTPEAGKPYVHDGIEFIHRIMGVDVQLDHFWIMIAGFSAVADWVVVHCERVMTWDEVADRQKTWDVPDENVMVDQSHRGQEVVQMCSAHGHAKIENGRKGWASWKACRGSDYRDWPFKSKPTSKPLRLPYRLPYDIGDPCVGLHLNDPRRLDWRGKFCPIITWSNPTIKDVVIARRDGKARGVKCFVSTGEWNRDYGFQMHSQKKVKSNPKYGGGEWRWERFRDDHLFDCACMIHVRAFQLGIMGGNSA